MKNWTRNQIVITCLGYIGLFIFGFGYFSCQQKGKVRKENIETLETKLSSQTDKYIVLEQKYEDMAHELDSLYFVVDVDGSILEDINR